MRSKFVPVSLEWLRQQPQDRICKASAEIQSLHVMTRWPAYRGASLNVRLLAPDTLEAFAAALVVSGLATCLDRVSVQFDPRQDVIPGLQVYDYDTFLHRGLPALMRRLSDLVRSAYDEIIINGSSGYRAILPYLSAFALVQGIPVVVQFEQSPQLMVLPRLPMELKWGLVEQHHDQLVALRDGIDASVDQLANDHVYQRLDEMGLVEGDEAQCVLSPLGEVLLGRYEQLYAFVLCDRRALHQLKNAGEVMLRIVADKFCNHKERQQRTEKKNGHYVFDNGDNSYRIYFLEPVAGSPVIYQLFTDHARHQRFYEQVSPPRAEDLVPVRCRIERRTWHVEEVES